MKTSTKPDKATVEVAGRNWLMARLLTRGFEVAVPVVDRGVDLIVFREVGEEGIRALPLQLKCASAESFSVDKKYAGRGIPLIYVWNVLSQPVAYMLTYDEVLEALNAQAASTKSFSEGGIYNRTSIGQGLRSRLQPYVERWDWLDQRLKSQPASGAP